MYVLASTIPGSQYVWFYTKDFGWNFYLPDFTIKIKNQKEANDLLNSLVDDMSYPNIICFIMKLDECIKYYKEQ